MLIIRQRLPFAGIDIAVFLKNNGRFALTGQVLRRILKLCGDEIVCDCKLHNDLDKIGPTSIADLTFDSHLGHPRYLYYNRDVDCIVFCPMDGVIYHIKEKVIG